MKNSLLIIVGMVLGLSFIAFAFSSPGSDQDPLITLSYVEKRLDELKAELTKTNASTGTASPVFEVFNYKSGTRLAFSNSTEFIVRRGLAVVVDPLNNKIPDLTTGVDIEAGKVVPLNHLLLVPQEDGRGISVTEDIWIMIKGPFVVIE